MNSIFGQPQGQGNPQNQRMAGEAMYGGDPRTAMMMAMRNMGINPFRSNPFIQMMLQAAPGLQMAHRLTNIGANANDVEGMGGPAQMFGSFLQNQIGGGNVFSTLGNVGQNLGGYMGQLRDYQNRINSDPNQLANVSPFAEALDELTMTPGGIAGMYTSLLAPGMGGLGRSWAGGVNNAATSAYGNYLNGVAANPDPNYPLNNPFMDYLFPRR